MAGQPRPLVAGNWKMNGMTGSAREIKSLVSRLKKHGKPIKFDIAICPPATLLDAFRGHTFKSALKLGGQDCHMAVSGAHTGDISAEMLKNAGARYVIVGHSERRQDHGEINAEVAAKAQAAHRAGLIAIICVGESEAQRRAKQTTRVVNRQLEGSLPAGATARNTVIAYEPFWAIGTGLVPSLEDVGQVHAALRKKLCSVLGDDEARGVRILYGGSVKPSNAKELMAVPNVNGALVGGASLKAKDFWGIAAVYV